MPERESRTHNFFPYELRMAMEATYIARYELRKTWDERQIKESLYRLALAFGLPRTKALMPKIYNWVIKNG